MVADDHPVVREGLKKMFEKSSNIEVTGEARNGQEVLNKVKANDYDMILLDISMPGRNWIEVLKELREQKPDLPVLIISMHKEEEYIVRALKAGAAGYLTKESLPGELITAVKKIHQGGKYITISIAEKLAFHLDKNIEKPLHQTLSDREYQVLVLIAKGKSTKEIAEELYLSGNTISTYRTRILEKMDMKNTAELIHYALKNGLVE
jgi:DNA-binding NarL/FixJ family response regulator